MLTTRGSSPLRRSWNSPPQRSARGRGPALRTGSFARLRTPGCWCSTATAHRTGSCGRTTRSEERRVGKECRCRWEPEQEGENGEVEGADEEGGRGGTGGEVSRMGERGEGGAEE